MAHNEQATPRFNATQIVLMPSQIALTAGIAGRIVASGSKLYFDNGSSWELITSG